MADLHSILWRSALDLYGAGDPRELARLIRDRTPAPADPVIGDEVCTIVADLIEGRVQVPRKRGPKAKATREGAELLYLGLRASGKAAVFAVDEVARHYGLRRASAYDLLGRVLTTGDKLARLRR